MRHSESAPACARLVHVVGVLEGKDGAIILAGWIFWGGFGNFGILEDERGRRGRRGKMSKDER